MGEEFTIHSWGGIGEPSYLFLNRSRAEWKMVSITRSGFQPTSRDMIIRSLDSGFRPGSGFTSRKNGTPSRSRKSSGRTWRTSFCG